MCWYWCVGVPFFVTKFTKAACWISQDPHRSHRRHQEETNLAQPRPWRMGFSGPGRLILQSTLRRLILYDGGLVVILRMAYSCPNHCAAWWRPWCSWSCDRQEETRGNGPRSPWWPRPGNFLCLALRYSFNPIFDTPAKLRYNSYIKSHMERIYWKREDWNHWRHGCPRHMHQTFHPLVPR